MTEIPNDYRSGDTHFAKCRSQWEGVRCMGTTVYDSHNFNFVWQYW
jgi:hypothetical protein